MAYLEKCDSPEKIMAFLKKLEETIIQQSQSQGNSTKKKNPTPSLA